MDIEPDAYYRIVDLRDKIVRGTAQLTGGDILIGTELGTDLGVDLGDKLRLTTAAGATSTLTIAGVVRPRQQGREQRKAPSSHCTPRRACSA